MRLNKKHKQLIYKLKQTPKCTVTPDDIYAQTDFFKEDEPKQKFTYKFAFMSSALVFIISLSFIVVLSVQNYKLRTKEPEVVYIDNYIHVIDDTQGMPEEEKKKITSELDYFELNPISNNVHNKEVNLFIYYGYNYDTNGNKIYYYYYAFSEFPNYVVSFCIYINSINIIVNNTNRYGLLTTIDSSKTDDFTISFVIETDDRTCEYILKNCNY